MGRRRDALLDVAVDNARIGNNVEQSLSQGDHVRVTGNYSVEPFVTRDGEPGMNRRIWAHDVAPSLRFNAVEVVPDRDLEVEQDVEKRGPAAGVEQQGVTSGAEKLRREAEESWAVAQSQQSLAPHRGPGVGRLTETGRLRHTPRGLTDHAALEVLRQVESQSRHATADKQRVLAGWTSWGAVPMIFDEQDETLADERQRLREHFSDSEWESAKAATLNAHYTDPRITGAVWQALQRAGFEAGRVLEPGSGAGAFIDQAPAATEMVGLELDETTARISARLDPQAQGPAIHPPLSVKYLSA